MMGFHDAFTSQVVVSTCVDPLGKLKVSMEDAISKGKEETGGKGKGKE